MATDDVRAPQGRRKGGPVTAIQIAAWAKAGAANKRHGCGGGLYLQTNGTAASWVLRYRIGGGQTRWIGLGRYDPANHGGLSLAGARRKVDEAQALRRAGRDPLLEREVAHKEERARHAQQIQERGANFRDVAVDFIRLRDPGWRSHKHALQWSATLATYAYPIIGSKPVGEIDTNDALAILRPIWASKAETASRVRGRCEAILDAAKIRGLRTSSENPFRWKGHLALLLPLRSKVAQVRHYPALPWPQIPRFMTHAAEQSGAVWQAIRFGILTAARSGELRGTRWSEIDLSAALWIVPAERMKGGREHRVPLSATALELLHALADGPDAESLIFRAAHGGALSDMALTMQLRRSGWKDAAGRAVTAHGFRSSFRSWCADAGKPADQAEAALAHVVGNAVARAYQRSDLLEARRGLMDAWAAYCCPIAPSNNIVPLKLGAADA
jgi:integrase